MSNGRNRKGRREREAGKRHRRAVVWSWTGGGSVFGPLKHGRGHARRVSNAYAAWTADLNLNLSALAGGRDRKRRKARRALEPEW